MTYTPTAKELFLALWQARMGGTEPGEGFIAGGPDHYWGDEAKAKWEEAFDACVDLADSLADNYADDGALYTLTDKGRADLEAMRAGKRKGT